MSLYQAIYFRGVLRIGWLCLIQVSYFSHLIIGIYIYKLLTLSNIKKSSFFLHSDSPLVIHFISAHVTHVHAYTQYSIQMARDKSMYQREQSQPVGRAALNSQRLRWGQVRQMRGDVLDMGARWSHTDADTNNSNSHNILT